MKSLLLLAALSLFIGSTTFTHAVTAVVTDDTTASTALPRASYRSTPTLNVATTLSGVSKRVFIRFDLSALPDGVSGAKIEKATLRLFCSNVKTAGSISIAPASAAWSEEILIGAKQPTVGDTEVAGLALKLTDQRRWVAVDVTPLVRDWVDGVIPNHGIAITPDFAIGVRGIVAAFDSKENAATGHEPSIEISLAGNGATGPQGPVGAEGPVGPRGLQGEQGATGPIGPQGVVGAIGPVGPQGAKGDRGDIGMVGPQGGVGPIGPIGPQGLIGEKGDKGDKGDLGNVGPAESQGLTGATGVAGQAYL